MIDYQRMEKYSVCTLVVGLFLLSFFSWSYALGFLLGGLLSTIGFEMIVYSSRNAPLVTFTKSLKRNRVFRYLIYIVIIFIAIYFRNVFNLVCFAVAVSINRIAIVVANKVSKGGDKNNDFDI